MTWAAVAVVAAVVVLALRAIGSERAAADARVALADERLRVAAATATAEAQQQRGDELERQLATATVAIGERDARMQTLVESLGRAGAGGAGAAFDLLPAAGGAPGDRHANDRPAVPTPKGGNAPAAEPNAMPGRVGGVR